ncbi:hydrolase (Partial), partial [Seminavis robusta]|eukprot:Sro3047_g342800.1 hydrolase (181) ;mRNA; f:8978-9520
MNRLLCGTSITSRGPLLFLATVTAAATTNNKTNKTENEANKKEEETLNGRTGLLFLGTGSSTGCPKPLCTMIFGLNNNNNNTTPATQIDPKLKAEFQHRCQTSMAAIQGGDPKHNKNYRNNPALLLSLCNTDTDTDTDNTTTTTSSDQKCHNILIDAGKTFREAALRWFPEHQIQTLDAII